MKARGPLVKVFVGVLPAALLLAAASCGSKPTERLADIDAVPAWFEDVTSRSGIQWTYRNGEEAEHLALLEEPGGGIALIDYDGDGLLDVFVPGGGHYAGKDKKTILGHPSKMYRNLGGGKFEDVTQKVGLDKLAGGKAWFYSHGGAVGDYDRDGWPDLLVTGWRQVALFKNVPVDPNDAKKGRRFQDVTAEAGLDIGITWATSAAFADLDGDGWQDLYICQYTDWSWETHHACTYDGKTLDSCPPKDFNGIKHKVYRNNRDGTFSDQSDSAGLQPGGPDSSKGLGVIVVDVNGDGRPDVYVANDTVPKFLYLNESRLGQIRFREVGTSSGSARDDHGQPNGSMGLGVGDYNRSGKPSLWVTNYETELHALYRNESKPGHVFFSFATQPAGIAALGRTHVGWGTALVDFDLDGWEDIFIANGHVIRFPTNPGVTRLQKPVLLRNVDGKFEIVNERIGPYGKAPHLGRGVGFGDLDNDGRVDLVISHVNEPVAVLRNVAGKGHHWLGVRLVGKDNACTVGAKLEMKVGDATLTRFDFSGGSYASTSDPRHMFGLGNETRTGTLTVTWRDGTRQQFTGLAADHYHRIVQGKDRAEVVK
jgi:hypothetical protein